MIRLIIICALFAPLLVGAQLVKEEVELYQSIYGMEKKKVVAQTIQLVDQNSQDFWIVYDEYEDKRKALGQQRISNIFNYVNNYKWLTNAQHDNLVSAIMKQRLQLDRLIKKYHKKVKKITNPKIAAQFVQLELLFLSTTRKEIMSSLPIVGSF